MRVCRLRNACLERNEVRTYQGLPRATTVMVDSENAPALVPQLRLVRERLSTMNISPDQNQPDYQTENLHHRRKPAPARSREHKWTQASRKNVRRKSNSTHNSHKKAGMHRRRNRRMSW